MAKKTKPPAKKPSTGQESILREAWANMSRDFQKLLPEKLRKRIDKKKAVFWLFILELVVLGVIGKLIYEWWVGR